MLDEPVDLPEGTVVDLVPVDQGDDLDDDDRARLHAALDRSQRDFLAGRAFRQSKCWQNSARDQVGEIPPDRILPRRS